MGPCAFPEVRCAERLGELAAFDDVLRSAARRAQGQAVSQVSGMLVRLSVGEDVDVGVLVCDACGSDVVETRVHEDSDMLHNMADPFVGVGSPSDPGLKRAPDCVEVFLGGHRRHALWPGGDEENARAAVPVQWKRPAPTYLASEGDRRVYLKQERLTGAGKAGQRGC